MDNQFSLLAAIRYFGWGGLGKLRLILDELPNARVTLYGNARITGLTKELLGSHHKFSERAPEQADVALVINDAGVANKIASLNVPVVYVDSLPWLRKTDSEIPALDKIAYYCGQKYPAEMMPLANPSLRNWPGVRWIDPIVPAARIRRGGRGIVINVGGLHSYDISGIDHELVEAAADAYLKLVVFPLAGFLQASGRKVSAVCGNLRPDDCARIRSLLPACDDIGPQTPYAFERTLMDADLLITSPGSTTILQAMLAGLPALLLPPQVTSQIYNARFYSRPGAEIPYWPEKMLDIEKIEEARTKGLVAVTSHVYRAIVDAAASPQLSDEVAAAIRRTLENAPADGVLNQGLLALGAAGASQVAALIKQAMILRAGNSGD